MTFDALDALFAGPLEAYRGRMIARTDARPASPGTDLLDRAVLAERLARFALGYAEPDPRAVASLWAKHHFAALIAPTLAALIVLGRVLPVRLDALAVVAGEDGRTLAFKLDDLGPPVADVADPFEALVAGHLAPLVAALARVSGLAPKVIWSNAGNMFEFVVRRTAALPLPDPRGHEAAARLLATRRHDGAPNPLFEPLRDVPAPEGTKRQRRVCCLRYRIPALSLCAACPLTRRPS